MVEIHGAHGYLIHQFVSPLTNKRNDEYGMDLPKFGVEVIEAVKKVIPESLCYYRSYSIRTRGDHTIKLDSQPFIRKVRTD